MAARDPLANGQAALDAWAAQAQSHDDVPAMPDDLPPFAPVEAYEQATAPSGGESDGLRFSAMGFDDTDMANARRIAEAYGSIIRWTPQAGWLVWDNTRWIRDEGDVRIQALAKERLKAIYSEIENAPDQKAMFTHARRSQSRRAIDNAIALTRSERGIAADLTDFDTDPWLLNVANGTLDLRTGQLRPHDRANQITKLAPVEYDANASCELWGAFLSRITDRNDDLYGYMRRSAGYYLTGLVSEQVLQFLFGAGANGKSVLCSIIEALLGDYAIVCSPEMVMARRNAGIPNDIARLRGVRLAMMNETNQGSRFDEAKLKDLTGGDKLSARFLQKEFFDFHPTHKLVIRGNHKPTINGTDEGIWRRLHLIPFLVQIPEGERDRQLTDKLRTELPGILAWAVRGCQEWQSEGLKPPACITEAVREYRSESDTLGRFIEECCEVLLLGDVRSSDFLKRYREFAEAAGERAMQSKDLPAEMQRRGFKWKRTKNGGRFEGIRFPITEPHSWQN